MEPENIMITITVTIQNKLGLHARAAAKFVSTASHYTCLLEVKKGTKKVNGKSIMGVMTLAASKGTELEILLTGDDAEAAAQDLQRLVDGKFGEAE